MAIMRSREAAIARACALMRRAAELSGLFPRYPADCFCETGQAARNPVAWNFMYDEDVFAFVDNLLTQYEQGQLKIREAREEAITNKLDQLTEDEKTALLRAAAAVLLVG